MGARARALREVAAAAAAANQFQRAATFCEIGRAVGARGVGGRRHLRYRPIADDSRTGGDLGRGERFPGRCRAQ